MLEISINFLSILHICIKSKDVFEISSSPLVGINYGKGIKNFMV